MGRYLSTSLLIGVFVLYSVQNTTSTTSTLVKFAVTLETDPPNDKPEIKKILHDLITNINTPQVPVWDLVLSDPANFTSNDISFCKESNSTGRLNITVSLRLDCHGCGCTNVEELVRKLSWSMGTNNETVKIFQRTIICGRISDVVAGSSCIKCDESSGTSNTACTWKNDTTTSPTGDPTSSPKTWKTIAAVCGSLAGLALLGGIGMAIFHQTHRVGDENKPPNGQNGVFPFPTVGEAPTSVPPAGTS